jgi:23S rRNA pseudouridine1911/1915/1917 synthase
MIAAGAVTQNGVTARAKDPVAAGDVLVVTAAGTESLARLAGSLKPVAMALVILYEDEHLIVLDKPAGLTVHPGAGTTAPTLVEGLLHHCGTLGSPPAGSPLAVARPGIVHRLDKDTSGVIVCAKTDQAHAGLARQFHDKTNRREYVALLDGVLKPARREHVSYLHRDPGVRVRFASTGVEAYEALRRERSEAALRGYRRAQSLFQTEAVYGGRLTLARVVLKTGRTHQIRVHAKDLGAPVWGDAVYGKTSQLPAAFDATLRARLAAVSRQLLHAALLGFTHPVSGRSLVFEASYPPDFEAVLAALAPYRQTP